MKIYFNERDKTYDFTQITEREDQARELYVQLGDALADIDLKREDGEIE
jgi:hypothetical protein